MMTSVYSIELDGAHIQTREDFFRELRAATGIDHVENLDALDEDLVAEIPLRCGAYRIVWTHADKSDWSGYSEVTKILGLLFRQQQSFPDYFRAVELRFDPDPTADTWTFPKMYDAPYYREERRKRGVE